MSEPDGFQPRGTDADDFVADLDDTVDVSFSWVSARDYAKHWREEQGIEPPAAWNGVDRRVGADNRRANAHDRRFDAQCGRRRFMGTHDRRRRKHANG